MQFDHDDTSLSKDSVLDWGNASWASPSLPSAFKGGREDPPTMGNNDRGVSRYDPRAMGKIADVVDDLLEDGGSDSDDDAIVEHSSRLGVAAGSSDADNVNNGQQNLAVGDSSLIHRQALMILSMVAIIFAASAAIGRAVVDGDPGKKPRAFALSDGGASDQKLLDTAERVVAACGDNELNKDRSECQRLCHSKLCCFQSGDYSCEEDDSKECAVYAGCEALLEGIPLEAAEEDKE